MTKIIIPESKILVVRPERSFDVKNGELVLMLYSGRNETMALGVFDGVDEARVLNSDKLKQRLNIKGAYTLRKCSSFGGVNLACLDKLGDRSYFVSQKIQDFYSGQKTIVEYLKNKPGFEPHAEWERLTKPYIR